MKVHYPAQNSQVFVSREPAESNMYPTTVLQYLIAVFPLLQGRQCHARPPGRDAVSRRLVTSNPADATPAGGLRPPRLQAVWLEEEPEPRVEQPEHDGGQGNDVSVLRLRVVGGACSTCR